MIYRLQDKYDYVLPELPEKHEILFYDLPKSEQHWRHPNYDYDTINDKWSDSQKLEFVKQEINRRINGIWFYNNGEPTYITGSHYFFLTYFKLPLEDGMGFPTFRRYQKDFFYFLDLTAKDKYCEGGAVSKPRRIGITACFNGDVMNLSMLKADKKFSIQNKTGEDAVENNYDPIKYNVEHFPSIKLSNGKEVFAPKVAKLLTKGLKFGTPTEKLTGTEKNQKRRTDSSKEDELNTQIKVVNTVENADDGKGTYRVIRDEVSKYPAAIDIENMLRILRPVCNVGTQQRGKIYFFGTSDEKDTENFERWKNIYWTSVYAERTKRKTETGLYNYFISGKYAIEGEFITDEDKEVELFDVYGECKEEFTVQWIEDKKRPLRMKGDLAGLQGVTRQFPIEESDPFESSSTSTCYDNPRLTIQQVEIEKKSKDVFSGKELPFAVQGFLEWVVKDKEVKFVPDINGHWTLYELPHERWKNKNYVDRYGYLNPDDTSPYLWTADPIDYREFIADGSKAAIVVGCMGDALLKDGGEIMCARYLHRPINPNDVIENVRMAAIFWAAKGTPEINKAWLAIDLMKGRDDDKNNREKMGRFLLTWDAELKSFRQWRYNEIKIAGFSSGAQSIQEYVNSTAMYLKEPRSKEHTDRIKTLWDLEVIKQLKLFNPSKTTKFDLAVAFSIWCMLLKNYKQKIVNVNNKLSDGAIMKAWFGIKERNNKGVGVY